VHDHLADADVLTDVAAAALDAPVDGIEGEVVEPLGHTVLNPSTGGLWRVSGIAATPTGARPWTAVAKLLTRPRRAEATIAGGDWAGGEEPSAWNRWDREAHWYRSALPATLPAGLRAPRLLADQRLDEDRWLLWLEDVDGRPGGQWTDVEAGAAARLLGRWQGAWVAEPDAPPLPEEPWLTRGHLRAWTPTEEVVDLDRLGARASWRHPIVAAHVPDDLPDAVRRVWARRDELLARVEDGPRTLAHHDVWPPNLVATSDGVVLLDWAHAGVAAPAEDVATLVYDSAFMFRLPLARLPGWEAAVLDGYAAGLLDAGAPTMAAAAAGLYAAVAALRFGLLAGAVVAQAMDDAGRADAEARHGRPLEEIVATRAALVRRALEV